MYDPRNSNSRSDYRGQSEAISFSAISFLKCGGAAANMGLVAPNSLDAAFSNCRVGFGFYRCAIGVALARTDSVDFFAASFV